MVIAVAIMTIIFTAILPLFASIRNSWDTKQANAELLQNGRVLIDHFYRNLSKAIEVNDVSDSSETDGYIQFEDNDGNNWRYERGANNYVQFGAEDLYDLAGPVSTLQFTCYGPNDFNNPTTDVNSIRFITIQTTLTNPAVMGQDKILTASVYLRTNGNNQALWENQDVGDVGTAGSAGCSEDTWTIEGSGDDIFGDSDAFHFVYQPLSSDGQIIARVVSIENTGGWPGVGAKAGVMIRETLDEDSRYAGIFVTPYNGAYFQRRTNTGGSTDFDPWGGSSGQTPIWFKLTRIGNTFTAYKSSDGFTWTQVGPSDSVTMSGDVYIGMAVCSNDNEVLCTAVFDNVSLSELTYKDFTEAKVDSDEESITIDTPSDTVEGDLLIAAVATDGDTSSLLAPPSEWTAINVDDNSEVTLGAWWKLADASEPTDHEFTWSGAGGQQAYGWIMRFIGHNPDAPIYSTGSDFSDSPTSPAVTTTVDNCLILRLGAFDDDDIEVNEPGLSDHTVITMDESAEGSCWQNQDIGDVGKAGSANCVEDTWTIEGSGNDIFGISDAFHFVYQPLSSDGQIIARVFSLDNTGGWPGVGAKAGVMIRETLYEDSRYAGIFVTPDNGAYFQRRTSTGGSTDFDPWGGSSAEAPIWFKLKRIVNTFTAYKSSDGYTWTQVGPSDSVTMSGDVYIGMAVCSNDYGVLCTAVFDNVTAPATGAGGTVSGGAGYVKQSSSGDSGTSNFSLTASNEARMLTIAIAPNPQSGGCSGSGIRP